MRYLKRAAFAAIATFSSISFATAADLRRPAPALIPTPIPNWTGCYVGGNVGAGWGRGQITDESTGAGVSATNSGFVGGIQAGCDYQFSGGFVVGVRDMFSGTNLSGSTNFATGPLAGARVNSDTQWFNTLTARIGYAVVPSTLVYFQAGGAWTRTTQDITTPAGVQIGQFANNKGGYDVGVGVEYMFAPRWTAFLEYNYMDFGRSSGTTSTGIPVSAKHDKQTLVLGVNYRF